MNITNDDIGKDCLMDKISGARIVEYGTRGTIIDIVKGPEPQVGIRFNKRNAFYHSCDGRCEMGFGRYVNSKHIIKVLNGEINGCNSIW